MPDPTSAMSPAFRLLLACARLDTAPTDDAAIRACVAAGPDWTGFARAAIDHGLVGLAGATLQRVAADLVPPDLLEAFGTVTTQARRKNIALFRELADLIEALQRAGITAIPFKGPILALQTFGDIGRRSFRDLDFLIREADLPAAIAVLHGIGYLRTTDLTTVQLDLIHRMQGQEIIFNATIGTAIEPHSRLTSRKMALDIDYPALWRRAVPARLRGRAMMTLAPEDELVILAIHGGKEVWWNIKWACDVAAFIAAHPDLDWPEIVARARAQGCLRMVLLAVALARAVSSPLCPRPSPPWSPPTP